MSSRISLLVTGILALTLSSAFSTIAIVDQQNASGGSNSVFVSSGQSFTPSLTSVNVADFSLFTNGTSSTVRLDLFAGLGYTGSFLGSSAPFTFTNTASQTIEFNFATSIALVPGNQYTFRLTLTSGDPYRAQFSSTNPYAGGTAYQDNGTAASTVDLVFAEGIPEPSVNALLFLGFVGAAGFSARRRLSGFL